jgi:hypothetical protein
VFDPFLELDEFDVKLLELPQVFFAFELLWRGRLSFLFVGASHHRDLWLGFCSKTFETAESVVPIRHEMSLAESLNTKRKRSRSPFDRWDRVDLMLGVTVRVRRTDSAKPRAARRGFLLSGIAC